MKGTKDDFDPYTYGQVRLDSSQGPDASAGRAPEDILFQPSDAPPPGGGFGMSAYSTEVEQGPGAGFQFDSEILGESGPGLAPVSAQPFGGPPAPPLPPSALTQRPGSMSRPAAEFEPAAKPQARPREVPVAPMRPRHRSARMGRLGLFMPTLMLACGLGAGAWMYLVWQNVVLALLIAALGSVGAAFTWIWVRS